METEGQAVTVMRALCACDEAPNLTRDVILFTSRKSLDQFFNIAGLRWYVPMLP